MSIFENPFKKKVPAPERQEPQALTPERASQGEAADPNEPTLTMPEPKFANDAFAQGPETPEQEAERHFNRIAAELNMSPDDLRSLEPYTRTIDTDTQRGIQLGGIRGTQNGVAEDVRQEWSDTLRAAEIVATIGDRTIRGREAEAEFTRLRGAYGRKVQWTAADRENKDTATLEQVRGAA